MNPPDQVLVDAAISGDAGAFAALLRRHDDKMRGVVWRVVGSRSAMDDVLQEAYLKAWQGLAGYRQEAAFTTWLYTIVHRSAVDHLRRQRRLRLIDQGDHDRAESSGQDMSTRSPDASGDRHHADHAGTVADSFVLRDALAALSPDHLAVVTLIDGEGRDYDEVAELLDVAPGTVASRLHRARAVLRTHLASAEETP